MNTPFLCVFLTFLLNYLTKFPLGIAMAKSKGGYDNAYPRDQQASLTGFGKRALGAHLNGFEIFPAFAASVIIAHLCNVDEHTLSLIAITFLVSRIIYLTCYYANKHVLRSSFWFIGAGCVTANFVLALF